MREPIELNLGDVLQACCAAHMTAMVWGWDQAFQWADSLTALQSMTAPALSARESITYGDDDNVIPFRARKPRTDRHRL
jgi:hypothetical protein